MGFHVTSSSGEGKIASVGHVCREPMLWKCSGQSRSLPKPETLLYCGYIVVILGLYWGYIGIMEK